MTKKEKEVLEQVRMMFCAVCGHNPPNDPDHIKTRGSGGGNTHENLWALCRQHHTERHKIGIITFVRKHPQLKFLLGKKGQHTLLDKIDRVEKIEEAKYRDMLDNLSRS